MSRRAVRRAVLLSWVLGCVVSFGSIGRAESGASRVEPSEGTRLQKEPAVIEYFIEVSVLHATNSGKGIDKRVGDMPELKAPWGYPIVMVGMLVIGLSLLLYFKRRGWFGGGSR